MWRVFLQNIPSYTSPAARGWEPGRHAGPVAAAGEIASLSSVCCPQMARGRRQAAADTWLSSLHVCNHYETITQSNILTFYKLGIRESYTGTAAVIAHFSRRAKYGSFTVLLSRISACICITTTQSQCPMDLWCIVTPPVRSRKNWWHIWWCTTRAQFHLFCSLGFLH